MSDPSTSPAAKVNHVVQGVLFGNVTFKDILDGVVMESSDLDSTNVLKPPDGAVAPSGGLRTLVVAQHPTLTYGS